MNPHAESSPAPRTTRHASLWSSGNLARVTCNALSSQTGHFLFQSGGHGFASFPVTPARVAQIGASRIAAKSLSPLLCAIYDLLTIGNSCKRISVYSVHG